MTLAIDCKTLLFSTSYVYVSTSLEPVARGTYWYPGEISVQLAKGRDMWRK